MSKLSKSMAELDAMADELLSKSMKKSEDATDEGKEKELKPEEISENVPGDNVENTDDSKDKKEESEETEEKEEKEEKIEKSVEAEDSIEESEESEDKEDEIEKSLKSDFESDSVVKESIEVSEFLSSVVSLLTKSLADTQGKIIDQTRSSDASSQVLAKSLHATLEINKSLQQELLEVRNQNTELMKSLNDNFSALQETLTTQYEQLSHQPANMRKSLGSVSIHDKNFQKSLGNAQVGEQLSKSEVLSKMNNMLFMGNNLVTPTDIISYESGAPLRPEIAQLIYNS